MMTSRPAWPTDGDTLSLKKKKVKQTTSIYYPHLWGDLAQSSALGQARTSQVTM